MYNCSLGQIVLLQPNVGRYMMAGVALWAESRQAGVAQLARAADL